MALFPFGRRIKLECQVETSPVMAWRKLLFFSSSRLAFLFLVPFLNVAVSTESLIIVDKMENLSLRNTTNASQEVDVATRGNCLFTKKRIVKVYELNANLSRNL